MEVLQLMLQHLAVTCLIQNHGNDYLTPPAAPDALLGMELGQIDILFHLFHLLLGDMFRSPTGTQTFQQGTDHVNILHILLSNTGDIGSLVGDDLNQSLQLQLTERLSDGVLLTPISSPIATSFNSSCS